MNEILVRTNKGQYVGGETIYGAVYLRIFRPVNAELVSLTFTGFESCEWKTTEVKGLIGKDTVLISSQGETEDENDDINTVEVTCSGRKELFKATFNLVEFEEGAVPLGCYAYPFHYTLQHGLPSGFLKHIAKDEDQNLTYKAGIYYEITAELVNPSICQTDMISNSHFEVKNEDVLNAFKVGEKPKRSVTQAVPSCFCFPRGEVSVEVQLDDISYTPGRKIHVNLQIENTSSTPVKTGSAKVNRIIILSAYESQRPGEKPVSRVTRVIDTVVEVAHVSEVGPKESVTLEIIIPLPSSDKESLPTTTGSVVKCRYHVEVTVKVPWSGEISLILPITIFPDLCKEWLEWQDPLWVGSIEIRDASGICSVPRHLLESREFMTVPLPIRGREL